MCFCELVMWLNQSLLGFVPNLIICELLAMFHGERVGLLLANPQFKANNPTKLLLVLESLNPTEAYADIQLLYTILYYKRRFSHI